MLQKQPAFLLLLVLAACGRANACAVALHSSESAVIANELAVVTWNPRTNVEHFIRMASADTTATDFGFIVPSPSVPKLATGSPATISVLDLAIQPTIIRHDTTGFLPLSMLTIPVFKGLSTTAGAHPVTSAPPSVAIEQSTKVAGLDAVTLKASDTQAIGRWMKQNGYVWNASLARWAASYVKAGWYLNAFRVDRSGSATASTGLLDMAISTNQPYFPYSEPAVEKSAEVGTARLLRIYVVSPQRMDAWLGAPSAGIAWPGHTIFASPLDSDTAGGLKSTLPSDVTVDAGQTWLTALDDTSSPRPGTDDVFFQPSKTQVAVISPPIDMSQFHAFMFPLDPLLLFGWIGLRRLRSRSYPNGAPALSLFTGAALGSALCAIAFDLMGVAGVNAMKANVEWPQQVLLGSLIGGMVIGALIAFRRFGGRPVP